MCSGFLRSGHISQSLFFLTSMVLSSLGLCIERFPNWIHMVLPYDLLSHTVSRRATVTGPDSFKPAHHKELGAAPSSVMLWWELWLCSSCFLHNGKEITGFQWIFWGEIFQGYANILLHPAFCPQLNTHLSWKVFICFVTSPSKNQRLSNNTATAGKRSLVDQMSKTLQDLALGRLQKWKVSPYCRTHPVLHAKPSLQGPGLEPTWNPPPWGLACTTSWQASQAGEHPTVLSSYGG